MRAAPLVALSCLAPVVLAVLPGSSAGAASLPDGAAVRAVPVVLDTDIGDDIDDTWALALILRSPELDLRLVTTDYGNTVYRAKVVARLLEVAGRTDVPIGIGQKENDKDGGQAEWVKGYDLARYPGTVYDDGVQALIDTVMSSKDEITLISIGPPPSLAAALAREPRIASRIRLAGMYGSLHVGYGGKPRPDAEWNVRAAVPAARALFAAPWKGAVFTPLDTCGLVQLKGDLYARVRDSKDPLLRAVVENFRLWCSNQEWCQKDPEFVTAKSSTLFDTVAVYLALSRGLVHTETLGVRVTDDGMTVPDPGARKWEWATEWTSLSDYETWLVDRLTGTPAH
jgi:inosine-uridine nucleoside N-ribohydrolase